MSRSVHVFKADGPGMASELVSEFKIVPKKNPVRPKTKLNNGTLTCQKKGGNGEGARFPTLCVDDLHRAKNAN